MPRSKFPIQRIGQSPKINQSTVQSISHSPGSSTVSSTNTASSTGQSPRVSSSLVASQMPEHPPPPVHTNPSHVARPEQDGRLPGHHSRWRGGGLHQVHGQHVRRRLCARGPRAAHAGAQPCWQHAGSQQQLLQVRGLDHAHFGSDAQGAERAGRQLDAVKGGWVGRFVRSMVHGHVCWGGVCVACDASARAYSGRLTCVCMCTFVLGRSVRGSLLGQGMPKAIRSQTGLLCWLLTAG
eukprot:91111-Chlamydomonas_euryale.AAC.7